MEVDGRAEVTTAVTKDEVAAGKEEQALAALDPRTGLLVLAY